VTLGPVLMGAQAGVIGGAGIDQAEFDKACADGAGRPFVICGDVPQSHDAAIQIFFLGLTLAAGDPSGRTSSAASRLTTCPRAPNLEVRRALIGHRHDHLQVNLVLRGVSDQPIGGGLKGNLLLRTLLRLSALVS
jgi:hypothetical protein